MSQMPLLTAFIKEDGVNEMLARSTMDWTVDVPWSPLEPRGACPVGWGICLLDEPFSGSW